MTTNERESDALARDARRSTRNSGKTPRTSPLKIARSPFPYFTYFSFISHHSGTKLADFASNCGYEQNAKNAGGIDRVAGASSAEFS
jgi:hypothetical protein